MQKRLIKYLFLLGTVVTLLYGGSASAGLVFGKVMGEFGNNTSFEVNGKKVAVSRGSYRVNLPPGSYVAVSGDGNFTAQIMSYPQPYEMNLNFKPVR